MRNPDCIFCRIVAGEENAWKVYEDDQTLAFFDINPINPYHTIVIPKRHFESVLDAPPEVLPETIQAAKIVADLLCEKLGIKNIQMISSSGPEAQQDVFHLHFHVVPRHDGDGQDYSPSYHPELVNKFDEMISVLQRTDT